MKRRPSWEFGVSGSTYSDFSRSLALYISQACPLVYTGSTGPEGIWLSKGGTSKLPDRPGSHMSFLDPPNLIVTPLHYPQELGSNGRQYCRDPL